MSLGYLELMNLAEQNSQQKKRELQKNEALLAKKNKKMDEKQVKLKVGVQKFLQKKEEEDRRKKEEEDRKKRQLLALRGQDRKATNRVKRMINQTKSANKAAISDARQCLEESADKQASEIQPDEDDYGYTSSYASQLYNQMVEKFKAQADKESKTPFKVNSNKKGRDEGKDRKSGGDRGSTGSSLSSSKDSNNHSSNHREPEKPKKKPAAPPPSFHDLLRLAEEKSKEPAPLNSKLPLKEVPDGPEKFEFGRPMTAREKQKYMRELEVKQRAQAKFSGKEIPKDFKTSQQPPAKPEKEKMAPIPKLSATSSASAASKPLSNGIPKPSKLQDALTTNSNSTLRDPPVLPSSSSSKRDYIRNSETNQHPSKPSLSSTFANSKVPDRQEFKKPLSKDSYSALNTNKPYQTAPSSAPNVKRKPEMSSTFSRERDRERESFIQREKEKLMERERERMIEKAREQKRKSLENGNREREREQPSKSSSKPKFPMNPYLHQDRPLPRPPRPRVEATLDSEEEYDSEMDDFIDDSDVSQTEISDIIGNLFRYNKRKYVEEDSDDECMETSVEQQMREEARSLRIGIMEDIEDMKKEEEEQKRKMMMKKKQKK